MQLHDSDSLGLCKRNQRLDLPQLTGSTCKLMSSTLTLSTINSHARKGKKKKMKLNLL